MGDFMVSFYLVALSVESVVRQEDFCRQEMSWLTSTRCELYGLISTFGSQLSIFSLTSLSLYRALAMRRVGASRTVCPVFKVKVILIAILLTVMGFLVAVLPTDKHLRSVYFYNGFYTEQASLFLGPVKLDRYVDFLEPYYGTSFPSSDISTVKTLVSEMFRFPQDTPTPGITFNSLGFYGSAGSCLFKYFVRKKDPQLAYSWFVISMNLACQCVVIGSYLSVHILSRRSSSKVGTRNKFSTLQRKIGLIIGTDLLVWLPFLVVCVLHYREVIDATPYYQIFSVIVLPINSLINPLLYDTFFSVVCVRVIRNVTTLAGSRDNESRRLSPGGSGPEQPVLNSQSFVATNVTAC